MALTFPRKRDERTKNSSQDFGLSLLSSIAASQSEQQAQLQSKIPLPRDPHARPYFMLNASSNQATADKNTGYLRREWDTKANGFVKWRLPDNSGIPPKGEAHVKRGRRVIQKQDGNTEAVVDKVLVPAGAQCVKDSGSLYSKFWLKPVVRSKKSQSTNADKYGFKKFYASKGKPDLVNSVVSEAYQYPQVCYHVPALGAENGGASQFSVAHHHGFSVVRSSGHSVRGGHSASEPMNSYDDGMKNRIVTPTSDYWPVYPVEDGMGANVSSAGIRHREEKESQNKISVERDSEIHRPGVTEHNTRPSILKSMLRKDRASTEAPTSSPLKELLSRRNSYDLPCQIEVDSKANRNLKGRVSEWTQQRISDAKSSLASTVNRDRKDAGVEDAGVDEGEMGSSYMDVRTQASGTQHIGKKRIRFLEDQLKVEELEVFDDVYKRAMTYQPSNGCSKSYPRDDECVGSTISADSHNVITTEDECNSSKEVADSTRKSISPSFNENQIDLSSVLNTNRDQQYRLVPALYQLDSSVCSPPSLQNQAEVMLFYYKILRSNSLDNDNEEDNSPGCMGKESLIHPRVGTDECSHDAMSPADAIGPETTENDVSQAKDHHICTLAMEGKASVLKSSSQTSNLNSHVQSVVGTEGTIQCADAACQTENGASKLGDVRSHFKVREQKSKACQTSTWSDTEFLFEFPRKLGETTKKACTGCCEHTASRIFNNEVADTEGGDAAEARPLDNITGSSELQSLLRRNRRARNFEMRTAGHPLRCSQGHVCRSAVKLNQPHIVPGCFKSISPSMDTAYLESPENCQVCTAKCAHRHEENKACFAEQTSGTVNALYSERGIPVIDSHCGSRDLGSISGESPYWCPGKSESCAHHKSKLTKGLMYCEICCLLSDRSQLVPSAHLKNLSPPEELLVRSNRNQGNVDRNLQVRQCAHYNKVLSEEIVSKPCCPAQVPQLVEGKVFDETVAEGRKGATNSPMYFCTKCCLVYESLSDYEIHFETSTSCRRGGRVTHRCSTVERGTSNQHQDKTAKVESTHLKTLLASSPSMSTKEPRPPNHLGPNRTCDHFIVSKKTSEVTGSSVTSSTVVQSKEYRNDLESIVSSRSDDHVKRFSKIERVHEICICTDDSRSISGTESHCSGSEVKVRLGDPCTSNNGKIMDQAKIVSDGTVKVLNEEVESLSLKMDVESQRDNCCNSKNSEATTTSQQQSLVEKSVTIGDSVEVTETNVPQQVASCRKRKLSVDESALLGRSKRITSTVDRRGSLCDTSGLSASYAEVSVGTPGGIGLHIPPVDRCGAFACQKKQDIAYDSANKPQVDVLASSKCSHKTLRESATDSHTLRSDQPLASPKISMQDNRKYRTLTEVEIETSSLDDRSSQSLSQLQRFVSENSRPSQNFWRCTSCQILFTTKAEYMEHLDTGACQSCFDEPRKQSTTVLSGKARLDVSNGPKYKVIPILLPVPESNKYYMDESTPTQSINDAQELDKCARIEPFVRCTRCSVLFTTYKDLESHGCKTDTWG